MRSGTSKKAMIRETEAETQWFCNSFSRENNPERKVGFKEEGGWVYIGFGPNRTNSNKLCSLPFSNPSKILNSNIRKALRADVSWDRLEIAGKIPMLRAAPYGFYLVSEYFVMENITNDLYKNNFTN